MLALVRETLVLGGSSWGELSKRSKAGRYDTLPISQQGVVPKGDVGKPPAFDLGMKRWGKWPRKGEQRDSRKENLKRERKIQAGRDKRKELGAGPSN